MISLEAELDSFKTDFIKRNIGKSLTTPNLYARDIKTLLLKQTYESPGGVVNDLIEGVNRVRKDDNYTPRTKNRFVSSTRSFLEFLKREGKIGEAILNSFLPFLVHEKVKEEAPPTLSRFEFEKIINVIPSNTYFGSRDRVIFSLMYYTGLRESEVINLTHSCLKEDKKNLVVEVQGKYKIRTIDLDMKTTKEMRNYLQYKENKYKRAFLPNEPLFADKKRNKPLCYRQPRRKFQKYAEKVEIKTKLHHLRDSYIEALVNNRKSAKEIADLVGIGLSQAGNLVKLFSQN